MIRFILSILIPTLLASSKEGLVNLKTPLKINPNTFTATRLQTVALKKTFESATPDSIIGTNPPQEADRESDFKNNPYRLSAPIPTDYQKLIEDFKKTYAPLEAEAGKPIDIRWQLNSEIFNATGTEESDKFTVTLYGGLIAPPHFSAEALRFLLCHELGHMLGGEPKFRILDSKPAPNSGQPDYYAAAVCMKMILRNEDNISFVQKNVIDQGLQQKCLEAHTSKETAAICMRSAMAAFDLFKVIVGSAGAPNFSSHDPTVATSLSIGHPNFQCRLDTVLAGSLCTFQALIPSVNDGDSANKFCAQTVSSRRPECWFPR